MTTARSGKRWRSRPVVAGDPAARAPSTAASDLDLAVGELRLGSEAGFVQVYRAVHPGLLRYLRVMVGEHAEDVAQETWAQVCRDLPQFTGDAGAFRAWLTTIGRNRALDHLRAHRRRPVDPVPLEQFGNFAGRDDTAAQAIDAITTETAIALIASLPPDQAEAVVLRAVLGLDAKRAGQIMSKRPGAVRTLAYRGLQTLAQRIEADRQ